MGQYIGGLVGSIQNPVSNSYATGNVCGEHVKWIGGLIGSAAGKGDITNSFASGNVTGNSSVGGLVGYSYEKSIINSYAVGKVSGETLVGGLIGDGYFPSVVNSYWDIQISEQPVSAGGNGKTTVEMMKKNTYQSWEFNKVWDIKEGTSYPTSRN